MKPITEARKELRQAGCANAQGDALRFMYANLLAFERGLSVRANSVDWPIPDFYRQLGDVADNKIYDKMQQMRTEFERTKK